MKVKTPKIAVSIITFSLITVSIIYAAKLVQLNNTLPEVTYHDMSTAELEEKVEELSQNGDLPFPMGMELMKRWAQR